MIYSIFWKKPKENLIKIVKLQKPLFSIIIPTYNRAADLIRCLDSLLLQTYKKFEVIVCDNASTDNTKDVISKYIDKLDLKYILLDVNSGGPARPRNFGIKEAIGTWICFLDSDDWYKENRLEVIANEDLSKFDFLYHDLDVIKNEKYFYKITSRSLKKHKPDLDLLINLNAIPTSSTCIRSCILKNSDGFNESKEIIGLEDYDFWINLAKTKISFYYIRKSLGYYYMGQNNLTSNNLNEIFKWKLIYNKYFQKNKTKLNNSIYAALYYNIGRLYLSNNKIKNANRYLFNALLYGSIRIKLRALNLLFKSVKRRIDEKSIG